MIFEIARRFMLSRAHSNGFLSFISAVSVVGVAIGVAALTVVTSALNGFEAEITKVITGMNGDLILYTRSNPVGDVREIEEKVRRVVPETTGISHSFFAEIMVAGNRGVSGAMVEGIDLETLGQVTTLPNQIVEGKMPEKPGELAIGRALAEKIGAKIGDSIRLILPFVGEADDASPRITTGTVTGILFLGMHQYDSRYLFAPLSAVQDFLQQPGQVTSFRIKLKTGSDEIEAARILRDQFGYPFRAKYWGEINRALFYAIKIEKAVIAVLLTAIIFVAAFNVISTLIIMVHDKSKEVSILRAMGVKRRQVFWLFCWIGISIGAVGAALGVLGGLGFTAILGRTQIIQLPPDVYNLDYLPMMTRWPEVALVAAFALLVATLASVFPALHVAFRSPLKGIRESV